MKKLSYLALGLSLLLLSGCGRADAPETTQPPSTEPLVALETRTPTTAPETTAATEEARETRPAEMEKTMIFEGTEVAMPMTLWDRPAYSLYFTKEDGWYMESVEVLGVQVDRYSTNMSPLIEFSVVYLGEGEELEAHDFLREAYPQLDVSSWDIGTWTGSSMETLEMLEARYQPGNGNSYLLIGKYPLEAAEGFGVRISGMMETFEIHE